MKTSLSIFGLLILFSQALAAQDTVRVDLSEFIRLGLEKSGQVQYEEGAVRLAENRIDEAKANRILPRVELNTNHGLVPGVVSENPDLPRSQYYLDPNLTNDWENWAIFTRAEITAVQPVFSWGAVDKAIRAAEYGAMAAEGRFEASRQEIELQLAELYYSYLLALEIERILADAESKVNEIGRRIEEMEEEEDPDLQQKDVFQFRIYKSEFEIQKTEVRQSIQRINRIWNYFLGEDGVTVYLPESDFLDPVPVQIESYDFYQANALGTRAELRGAEAGIAAYEQSIEALKAQSYPMLYLGLTANYANTPNRPRQSNPFIINSTNYMSAGFGFGIRQNLNFSAINNRIDRERIEYNRVKDLKHALSDQIILELNERYMEAVVAEERVDRLDEALVTSRSWVRHEQLNYDFGFGEVEDLVDSVRKELELRVELKQSIFELNKRLAALYKAAGIPVSRIEN
ncbi:MAG: TolC family protein [Balneolaceae bacterium]